MRPRGVLCQQGLPLPGFSGAFWSLLGVPWRGRGEGKGHVKRRPISVGVGQGPRDGDPSSGPTRLLRVPGSGAAAA